MKWNLYIPVRCRNWKPFRHQTPSQLSTKYEIYENETHIIENESKLTVLYAIHEYALQKFICQNDVKTVLLYYILTKKAALQENWKVIEENSIGPTK